MRGEIVYQYAFDVANEIATRDVQRILGHEVSAFEPRSAHTRPRDLPLYPALTVRVQRELTLHQASARIVVRVYELGVVCLSILVPFEVDCLEELRPRHQPQLADGRPLDDLARQLCGEVCQSLGAALIRTSVPSEPEAYTVFCLSELPATDALHWFAENRRDVAALLAEATADQLSDQQIEETLRIQRSYSRRDLVVIDWDASLIVDLDGYFDDVLYVLELANLQLEEFRVMDQRLDRHLDRVYRDLERSRSLWWGTPRGMLDWLRRFRVDVTKLADEVSHITKMFGDWYLARVYLGASERFHLIEWQKSVEERLSQLDEVYRLMQADVYERRMLWLEVAIVVCFIVDLLAIFLWKR